MKTVVLIAAAWAFILTGPVRAQEDNSGHSSNNSKKKEHWLVDIYFGGNPIHRSISAGIGLEKKFFKERIYLTLETHFGRTITSEEGIVTKKSGPELAVPLIVGTELFKHNLRIEGTSLGFEVNLLDPKLFGFVAIYQVNMRLGHTVGFFTRGVFYYIPLSEYPFQFAMQAGTKLKF